MTKFLQRLGLFLILTAGIRCKSTECQEKPNDRCVCTFQYDPVCGCNGRPMEMPAEQRVMELPNIRKGHATEMRRKIET